MEMVTITAREQLDDAMRRELPIAIREAWRKVLVLIGAYSKDYEQDETIWGLPMIEAQLENGGRWFVVRDDQGAIVGAVVADEVPHLAATALQLRTLIVHPRAQGQGIGEKIIGHLAEVAAQEGKRFLTLYTSSLLASLVRFYERIGFTEYERVEVERYGKRYARVFLQRPVLL